MQNEDNKKATYVISIAGSSVDHGVQIVTGVVWV